VQARGLFSLKSPQRPVDPLNMDVGSKDRGFSLVELLVVIVVLGILSVVVVFAVRGVADRGENSACLADRQTLVGAQEANLASTGVYTSEAQLVTNGLLRTESVKYDLTLIGGGTDYTLQGLGDCT